MNLFWTIFLAVALATQLPLILGLLYAARKIILGAGVLFVGAVVVYAACQEWHHQQSLAQEATKVAAEKQATTDSCLKVTASYENFMAQHGDLTLLAKEDLGAIKNGYLGLGHPEKAEAVDHVVRLATEIRESKRRQRAWKSTDDEPGRFSISPSAVADEEVLQQELQWRQESLK